MWKNREKQGCGAVYISVSEQEDIRETELAGRLLSRGFLECYGIRLKEGDILRDAYGKPYYAKDARISFNVSHCRNGAAAAFCDRPVGVDLERMRRVNVRTAAKCLSKEEMAYVFWGNDGGKDGGSALSVEEARRFLQLWTLKESAVKMTGEGLRTPLREVSFGLAGVERELLLGVRQVRGCRDGALHYLYAQEDVFAALTARCEETDAIPRFDWKFLPSNAL